MLNFLRLIAEACELNIAEQYRRPNAIVGAGEIVDYVHLPAYAKAGLKITGVGDIERDQAADVAERHGLVTCSSMLNMYCGETGKTEEEH
jgi:hypothetical protein